MEKAVQIRLAGDQFVLTLPGIEAEGSHEVKVPTYAPEILIRILANWQNANASFARKIGNDASPTQYMVESWLSSNEARVDVREARARADEREAALRAKYPDIDLSEIEL